VGMTALRHFPPPWSVEEVGADVQRRAFIVKDSAGQDLAYVYFEEGRRSAAKLLTKDEAGRMRRTSQSCRSWCGSRNLASLPKRINILASVRRNRTKISNNRIA